MGCQCANNTGESEAKSELKYLKPNEIIKNASNDKNNSDILKSSVSESVNSNYQIIQSKKNQFFTEIKNEEKTLDYDIYSQEMFDLINKIRQNPPLYAEEIENAIQNIREEKNKIIYKQRLKVSLYKGVDAFTEAADELKEINYIAPLEFKKEICIPLPEIEDDIKNSEYIKQQVKNIRKSHNIDVFYKDLIKDPDISALLMVVDDNIKNPGKKRKVILDENFKFIGITSGFVGKTFIAYFSFSKI